MEIFFRLQFRTWRFAGSLHHRRCINFGCVSCPIAFSFIQFLYQSFFENLKSRNKTVTYQQDQFVYFIFLLLQSTAVFTMSSRSPCLLYWISSGSTRSVMRRGEKQFSCFLQGSSFLWNEEMAHICMFQFKQ